MLFLVSIRMTMAKKEGSPASFIGFGLISPNWAKPTELLLPNVDDDDFDYYDDDDDDDDDD